MLLPGFMCDADLWADMAADLGKLGSVHYGNVYQDDTLEGMASRVLAELQKSGAVTPENVAVTILPTASTPPGVKQAQLQTNAEGTAKRANVAYKRISMQVIPDRP